MSEHDSFFHPETEENEVFFTNASREDFKKMGFKTKRIGTYAYDGNGNLLNTPEWFPIFLNKNEVEASGKSLMDLRRASR